MIYKINNINTDFIQQVCIELNERGYHMWDKNKDITINHKWVYLNYPYYDFFEKLPHIENEYGQINNITDLLIILNG